MAVAMIAYHPIHLGQTEPLYMIDRAFAGAILESLEVLLESDDIPAGWATEPCWINLRIRRWNSLIAFRVRLLEFTVGRAQALQITEEEEGLIGEVMTCVDLLLKKESAGVMSTLEVVGAVVGVVGGLIAVGVAVGIA